MTTNRLRLAADRMDGWASTDPSVTLTAALLRAVSKPMLNEPITYNAAIPPSLLVWAQFVAQQAEALADTILGDTDE